MFCNQWLQPMEVNIYGYSENHRLSNRDTGINKKPWNGSSCEREGSCRLCDAGRYCRAGFLKEGAVCTGAGYSIPWGRNRIAGNKCRQLLDFRPGWRDHKPYAWLSAQRCIVSPLLPRGNYYGDCIRSLPWRSVFCNERQGQLPKWTAHSCIKRWKTIRHNDWAGNSEKRAGRWKLCPVLQGVRSVPGCPQDWLCGSGTGIYCLRQTGRLFRDISESLGLCCRYAFNSGGGR